MSFFLNWMLLYFANKNPITNDSKHLNLPFFVCDYSKMLGWTNEDEVIHNLQCSLEKEMFEKQYLCLLIDSNCHSSTDQNWKEWNTFKMKCFKATLFKKFQLIKYNIIQWFVIYNMQKVQYWLLSYDNKIEISHYYYALKDK